MGASPLLRAPIENSFYIDFPPSDSGAPQIHASAFLAVKELYQIDDSDEMVLLRNVIVAMRSALCEGMSAGRKLYEKGKKSKRKK